MSIEGRLGKLEEQARGPGRDSVVTVHMDDPQRQDKIDRAKADCGPVDRLVVVECTGGYGGGWQ